MTILEALIQLRDDLKTWVSNNLLAIKEDIVQADFAQNDSTANDYVKNRLAYVESAMENILPETSVTFAVDIDRNSTYIDGSLGLQVGEIYVLTWNDVEYECECKEFIYGDTTMLYIGNMGCLHSLGAEDTGEEFLVAEGDGQYLVAVPSEEVYTANITLSIIKPEVIHQIDEKFIPDTIINELYDSIEDAKTIVIMIDAFDTEGAISMTGPEIVETMLNGQEVILASYYGIFRAVFVTWDGSTVVFHSTILFNDGGQEDPYTYEIRVDKNGNYELCSVGFATKEDVAAIDLTAAELTTEQLTELSTLMEGV